MTTAYETQGDPQAITERRDRRGKEGIDGWL